MTVPLIAVALLTACETPQAPNSSSGVQSTEDEAVDDTLDLGSCPANYQDSPIEGSIPWPEPLIDGVEPPPTCAATSDTLLDSPDKTQARDSLQIAWNTPSTTADDIEADISTRMEDAGYQVNSDLSFESETYWFTGTEDAPDAAASLTRRPTPEGVILVFTHTVDANTSD
jgi:hypothetical protein